MATINDVLAAIDGGDVDNDLDLISNAIKDRRKLLTKRMVRTVRVGQRVRFNNQTNPQYLRGVAATVTKVNQTRVAVKLDESVGRFNKEWPINTPADMLDLILMADFELVIAIPYDGTEEALDTLLADLDMALKEYGITFEVVDT